MEEGTAAARGHGTAPEGGLHGRKAAKVARNAAAVDSVATCTRDIAAARPLTDERVAYT